MLLGAKKPHLIVEKVNGVLIQAERQRLQKGDVVCHHFLVRKVELVDDDGVDVVI